MLFPIKMFNGKSNKTELMGIDEDGEWYVKDVIEKGVPDPNFREFTCSGYDWDNILELGRKMGWTPSGTVLKQTIDTELQQISDYQPSTWDDDDLKVFLAKDADELANALQKAVELMKEFQLKKFGKPSGGYINPSMDSNKLNQIIENLSESFLNDFIAFLRKGKFCFVLDDGI